MNVLFIVDTDWLRKTYRLHYHHIARHLSLRGHRVYVLDFDAHWQSKANVKRVQLRGGRYDETTLTHVFRPSIIRLRGLDRLSALLNSLSLLKMLISRYSIDIIITGSITYALPTVLVSSSCHKPFVYYAIDLVSTEVFISNPIFRLVSRTLEKYLCNKACKVLLLTPGLKQHVISLGTREDKTEIVPTGVSVDEFRPNSDANYIRKSYGLSDRLVVLYLGAIRKGYGLEKFIKSFPWVKREVPNCVYLFVGYSRPRDYVEQLASIAKHIDDSNSILFLGPCSHDRVPEVISASDICVVTLPPYDFAHNAFPIKLFEYMACAKPVVCTKLEGVKSVLDDSHIVFVDYDEKSIANAIVSLACDEGKRKTLGQLGHEFVEKNYDWPCIVDDFERLLMEVLYE